MASSARNIVRCLKPNGLGTRPRSSIPLRVRTYYIRERNKQGRSSWRPWDLQSSYIWNLQCKARRCHESPSWEVKNEGEKIFPRFARTDQRYAPLCTASGSVSYTVPPPFINPVSAPAHGICCAFWQWVLYLHVTVQNNIFKGGCLNYLEYKWFLQLQVIGLPACCICMWLFKIIP